MGTYNISYIDGGHGSFYSQAKSKTAAREVVAWLKANTRLQNVSMDRDSDPLSGTHTDRWNGPNQPKEKAMNNERRRP